MDDVIALFRSDYFVVGVRLALIGLLIGWVMWAILRSRMRILPIAGVLIVVSLVSTLAMVEDQFDTAIVPALALIAGGTGIARLLGASSVVQALASVPGALWLAVATDVTELVWVRVMLVALIPIGGYLVSDFELRHEGLGLGVIFYALATLGVFGAIPDTEWAVTLFGVSWVLAFLAWPKTVASMGGVGSYMAVAVVIWVSAHGGAPREASIIGAVACLGLLLLEPVIIRINPSAMRVAKSVRRGWLGAVIASIPQFLVVLICSRIAARFTSVLPALVIVGFVYGAVLTVGILGGPTDSPPDGSPA